MRGVPAWPLDDVKGAVNNKSVSISSYLAAHELLAENCKWRQMLPCSFLGGRRDNPTAKNDVLECSTHGRNGLGPTILGKSSRDTLDCWAADHQQKLEIHPDTTDPEAEKKRCDQLLVRAKQMPQFAHHSSRAAPLRQTKPLKKALTSSATSSSSEPQSSGAS